MLLCACPGAVTLSGWHGGLAEPCRVRKSQTNFHDAANRCHGNGLRFTWVVLYGHAGGWRDSARNLAWSPGSPTDPAAPLSAHHSTLLSNWLGASRRHSIVTPRVSFVSSHGRRVRHPRPRRVSVRSLCSKQQGSGCSNKAAVWRVGSVCENTWHQSKKGNCAFIGPSGMVR